MSNFIDVISVKNEDTSVYNTSIKRLFEPYTPFVDVTGSEKGCICILANLTSNSEGKLNDINSAKKVLKQDFFWDKVFKTLNQLHTHNLKWPDARVNLKHHIRVIKAGSVLPRMSWSGNSGDYRYARFFTSDFIWENQRHSLLSIWINDESDWRKAFRSLGINKANWYQIRRKLISMFEEACFPTEIDCHLPQIIFPYKDHHYITLTPVVAYTEQALIQESKIKLPVIRFSYPHPSALGLLCGSKGGHMQFLSFYPLHNKQKYFEENKLSDHENCSTILNKYLVTSPKASDIYSNVIDFKVNQSLRIMRKARLKLLKELDSLLLEWVHQLIFKRYGKNHESEINLNDFERAFVQGKDAIDNDFINYLNRTLHEHLGNNKYTKKYSYHQNLIGVTQNRLLATIKRVTLKKTELLNDDKNVYLVLHKMRICEANGLNNPYVAGMPSMIGLYGYAHNLQRKLQEKYPYVAVRSFALHCSSHQNYRLTNLPEPSIPEKENRIKRSGVLPKYPFDGTYSLIFKIQLSNHDDMDTEHLKGYIPELLWGGGLIPPPLYETTDWLKVIHSNQSLYDFISGDLFTGSWLAPSQFEPEVIEKLLPRLRENKDFLPSLVGYRLLENPTSRTDAYTGLHAFSEPIIGLCKRLGTYEIMQSKQSYINTIFWRARWHYSKCTTLIVGLDK